MKMRILAAVVLVLIGIAGGAYYYFLGTPSYSLYQVRKAIENHDSITFNKYVDIDRVVDGLVEEATKDIENDADDAISGFAAGFAKSLFSAMKDGLKTSIDKSIEEISQGSGDNKLSNAEIKEVKKDGKSAVVTLQNEEEATLEVRMIQTPERYWRVVGIGFEDFKKISPEMSKQTNTDTEETEKKKTEQTVSYGDKIDVGDGWFITIQKPETYIPQNTFLEPKKGNRIVAISVEYSNETGESDDVSPSNRFTVRDRENQVYEVNMWGGKEPQLKDDTLVPAGDKVKGYLNFEVPETAEISKVIYSNSDTVVTIQ